LLRRALPLAHTRGDAIAISHIEAAIVRAGAGGQRWRSGAVKVFLDGVIDQGTAWLGARDPRGRATASNWPDPERYAEVVRRCVAAGLGCATHAIGDRAIRAALDAYTDALRDLLSGL